MDSPTHTPPPPPPTPNVVSFMILLRFVFKLLQCLTPDGSHLGFVQYGRHTPQGAPILAPSRNCYIMVISSAGPKMVLMERDEQLDD